MTVRRRRGEGPPSRPADSRGARRRHSGRRPATEPPQPPVERTVTIDRIGHRGDGITRDITPPLYVPFVLPGETVRVRVTGERAEPVEIIAPSPERTAPLCRHFGICGGCALQHWQAAATGAWKRDQVVAALRSHDLDAEVAAPLADPVAARRRVVFSARGGRRGGGGARGGDGALGDAPAFGFQAARSHDLVDIAECPILAPPLQARLGALRALAAILAPPAGTMRMTVILADNGLDIAVEGAGDPAARFPEVIACAEVAGAARLTANGDLLYQRAAPHVAIDGVPVALPPGAFLQATRAAETAMQRLVTEACAGAHTVADLFSGLGTFALPLSRTAKVHAVDADAALIAALADAVLRAKDRRPVTTKVRNLFEFPLQPAELAGFDAAVFDPPRAGAAAQAKTLAAASLRTIVAVSCNPRTLARDLAILTAGGYIITQVTPLDQFVFSPHIEVVAVLRRLS